MYLEKHKPIRLQKIRDSARGQDCTVESPYCNHNPETVVLAHYGEPGEKGTSTKPDDTSAAYACSDCHDYLDGRTHQRTVTQGNIDSEYMAAATAVEVRWYWFRAMRRTWKLLIENGVLK